MKISELLQELDEKELKFQIYNEKSFNCLALVASNLEESTCIFIDDNKYINSIKNNVTMIITTEDLRGGLINSQYGLCIVNEPRLTFFKIHNHLADTKEYKRGKFKTKIGINCNISPLAYVAKNNVTIGNNTIIEEFVSIRENTTIGNNCIIRMGTKIGGEGFEFKPLNDSIMAVKHMGGVKIADNVELQQNNCIDKAVYPWDNTIIEDYSKTDNFVHIAHGVKMGKRVRVAASAMIAGRVIIRDDVWIGPAAVIINGIELGEKSNISLGSVVTQNVEANQKVTGNFAIDHRKFIEFIKHIR